MKLLLPFDPDPAKQKWLLEGYKQFGDSGPEHLSINRLSKAIGTSRASFYHHFGDMDIFLDELLKIHWQIGTQFNKIASETFNSLIPDLYDELAKHPVALRFNIQLFRHRENPKLNFLFLKLYKASAKAFALRLFTDHFGISDKNGDAYHLWLTLGEAWYSRLNPDDLSAETLKEHGLEIMKSVRSFMDSKLYTSL